MTMMDLAEVEEGRLPADSLLVRFARYYACVKHAGQQYSGGRPYSHHLEDVDRYVQHFWARFDEDGQPMNYMARKLYDGWDPFETMCWGPSEQSIAASVERMQLDGHWSYREAVRAAAWLHDVIEDQGVQRRELEELFGLLPAELVWRVSDEPGATREERHVLTLPKTAGHPLARFLKLCDRLSNTRNPSTSMMRKYRKEHPHFREVLWRPGEYEDLWKILDTRMQEET